jgi:NAD(P)-dependent dehydrogenase (short-subunit alcohol dehydrogenase family)
MGELSGKVAIVTGAASGICRVTAETLARAGARTVIADRNDEWGSKVADGIRAAGGEALYVTTDVTRTDSVGALFGKTLETYGGVDIFVNCAGVGVHKLIVEMTDQEWDFQADTAFRAIFLTCRAAARQMIAQGRGGRIINFGSTAGAVARMRAAAHCASKAGVVQFTKVLALEVGQYGITANVVAPGLTDIRKISNAYPTDEYIARFTQEVPLGRLADPQEIADVVAFVASDRARFLSGQAIYVDGGYSAGKISIDGPHRTVDTPPVGGTRP